MEWEVSRVVDINTQGGACKDWGARESQKEESESHKDVNWGYWAGSLSLRGVICHQSIGRSLVLGGAHPRLNHPGV